MTEHERTEVYARLADEIRKLRRELRELQQGELVARLSPAERQAIAREVLDRLDERFARERQTVAEKAPPRKAAGRGVRRYLGRDD